MKFTSGDRRKAVEYEADLVRYWKENKIFEKSVENRPKDNAYVFYDGPPFITGVPHHGTLLSSVVKDAIPRFWAMQGKRVERVWGWDCHGLPAEVFTEKKMNIQDKRDIGTKISLEEYITTCRDNMVVTGGLWEDTIDRIGRWVEFKNAYRTMDKEYMESVWWAFKKLYEKGKIYEGEKVLLYCTRDATPISKAEVAMDNSYKEITDPSVYVKFKLTKKSVQKLQHTFKESKLTDTINLLAWTTTPWTLNANTAIVVNKNNEYSIVLHKNEYFIVAKSLVEKVFTNEKHEQLSYEIVGTVDGSTFVGMDYEPLFANRGANAHKVWHADFVSDQDGTGIAHEAPAYGEDDYKMAKENKVPIVIDTDDEGYYSEGPWKGQQIWEINKQIAKELLAGGVVFKIEYIKHDYPHCHRCETKLQYRAHPSWFMDIDGQREEMLEQNGDITWFPGHIKNGRFEKTVESAPDWNLSRDRFWATAMPVWKGTDKDGKEHVKVVGSYQELKDLSGIELEDYHRPWVDDVTFTIDDIEYRRIDKVLDCWFESGSMPFAQFHYPFENIEKFEQNFPGDFIAEYVGQVRAWFYYLHAVNVGLFGKNAFKNVIVTGTLAGNDGRKMSKSFGNFTDPNELMDRYSADALRFLFLSSSLMNGEDFALIDKDVADISRKLAMVWNVYDFFTMYASVDEWESAESTENLAAPVSENVLDEWIISKVHVLISDVEKSMKEYDLQMSTRFILPFIDELSNWFVRRSRKRFWKSEDLADKQSAYATLHYALVQLAHVLAPFTPFMAEELYRKLTGGESVHLRDWPEVGHVNERVVLEMDAVRTVVNEGLSQRAKSNVKVRQPLHSISVSDGVDLGPHTQLYLDIVAEELNVKSVNWVVGGGELTVVLDITISEELELEGIARDVIRSVQVGRRDLGFDITDRIKLNLISENQKVIKAIEKFADMISNEVLAVDVQLSATIEYPDKVEARVDKTSLVISMQKSK